MNNRLPVKVNINPEVIMQEVEDEIVLLHMGTEEYFSLDDIGSVMWKLFSEHESVAEVIDCLLDNYAVNPDKLRNDVANLLQKLEERKLVTLIF